MKLLLTSAGISNKSLANVLRKMVKGHIKIAFIPTAANMEDGEKSWLINDLSNCKKLGDVDIVDISAMPKHIWLPRLKKANVIVFGGGVTGYLMKCIISSGLRAELPNLLKSRVYVGISAGSIAICKTIQTSSEFFYGDENENSPKGLGFVNFSIRPHLNSPEFPKVRDKNLRRLAEKLDGDLYAIDDDSAVLMDGNKIKVISEGRWKLYKKKVSKP
ncbi:MAG: Type 1 glutamine amidotransferase-like domain-containing protein [Candidatus Aenigmatarchaeota archaeon]